MGLGLGLGPSLRGASRGGAAPVGGPYVFAATRLNTNTASWTPTASQLAMTTRVVIGTPNFDVSNAIFILPGFVSAGASGDAAVGNVTPVTGLTIVVGGVVYNITVGGQAAFSIPDSGWLASDPLPVTLAKNSTFVLTSQVVQPSIATKHVGGVVPATHRGEGVVFAATADANLLQPAGVVNGDTNSVRPGWAPLMMIGQGWDGKPVYLLTGDSRQVNLFKARDARGNGGAWARALDDVTGGRAAYGNFGCSGATLVSELTAMPKRLEILEYVKATYGQYPFTDIADNLGINSIRANVSDSFATIQGQFDAWWARLKTLFPSAPLWRSTMEPVTADSNNRAWSTTADQTVATQNTAVGLLGLSNVYILTKPSPLAGVFDVGGAVSTSDKWQVPAFSATLTGAMAVSAAQCAMTASPGVGQNLVFNPGVTGVDYAREFTVKSATGASSPYTVTFGQTASKAQASAAPVALSPTVDGLHGLEYPSALGAAPITSRKAAGTLS